MKVRLLEIDGTPEEIARSEWLRQIVAMTGSDGRAMTPEAAAPDSRPAMELSPNLIRSVLERIPIPAGQARLYRCLAEVGSEGMTQRELADCNERSLQELAGVLGALGHRINATPGVLVPEGRAALEFFLQITRDNGEWRYVLRPSIVAMLNEIGFDWTG